MLPFRRYRASVLISALLLMGLMAPSMHALSHLHETHSAPSEDASPFSLRLEQDCPVCDLTSTLLAVAYDPVERVATTHVAILAMHDEGIRLGTSLLALFARAPPLELL